MNSMDEPLKPSLPTGMRRLAALTLVVGLAGCSGFDPSFGLLDGASTSEETAEAGELSPDEAVLAQAPPRYEVGDVFAFDNPDVTWQIVAIDEAGIHWVSDTGEKQSTDANPLLPALAWESNRRGSGKRLISDVQGGLYPLRVGNRMTFKSTVSTDKPPYAWEFDWSCEVLGQEFVDSPAGDYNAFKVMCGRQRPDELVFYYAPSVGHYLRMEVAGEAGEKPLIRNLVGFRRIAATRPQTQIIASQGDIPPPEPEAAGSGGNLGLPDGTPATIAPVVSEETGTATQTVTQIPQSGIVDSATSNQPVSLTQTQALAQPAASTSVGSSGFGLHLASYKSEASVDTGWKRLKGQLPGLIDGMNPVVKRVDLGSKGVFYRLHAAPVTNQAAAADLCRQIKARGAYCKVEAL